MGWRIGSEGGSFKTYEEVYIVRISGTRGKSDEVTTRE